MNPDNNQIFENLILDEAHVLTTHERKLIEKNPLTLEKVFKSLREKTGISTIELLVSRLQNPVTHNNALKLLKTIFETGVKISDEKPNLFALIETLCKTRAIIPIESAKRLIQAILKKEGSNNINSKFEGENVISYITSNLKKSDESHILSQEQRKADDFMENFIEHLIEKGASIEHRNESGKSIIERTLQGQISEVILPPLIKTNANQVVNELSGILKKIDNSSNIRIAPVVSQVINHTITNNSPINSKTLISFINTASKASNNNAHPLNQSILKSASEAISTNSNYNEQDRKEISEAIHVISIRQAQLTPNITPNQRSRSMMFSNTPNSAPSIPPLPRRRQSIAQRESSSADDARRLFLERLRAHDALLRQAEIDEEDPRARSQTQERRRPAARRREGDEPSLLAYLAEDEESSMTALTPSEKDVLEKIKSHYEPSIKDTGGYEAVFKKFQEDVEKIYSENPCKVEVEGISITLPLSYDDFETLLSEIKKDNPEIEIEKVKEACNLAYYKDETHSAYRWTLEDNKWMSDEAEFHFTDGGSNKRSSFKE